MPTNIFFKLNKCQYARTINSSDQSSVLPKTQASLEMNLKQWYYYKDRLKFKNVDPFAHLRTCDYEKIIKLFQTPLKFVFLNKYGL